MLASRHQIILVVPLFVFSLLLPLLTVTSILFDRIMMLSVLKHTKSKVKFWFLKNFLSPTFKVCKLPECSCHFNICASVLHSLTNPSIQSLNHLITPVRTLFSCMYFSILVFSHSFIHLFVHYSFCYFLLPTIQAFLPHMAKEYGCEYELVQYQWPRWLHAQTEKQRIIWG